MEMWLQEERELSLGELQAISTCTNFTWVIDQELAG